MSRHSDHTSIINLAEIRRDCGDRYCKVRRLKTVYLQLKESSGNILGFKIIADITEKQQEQICEILEKRISESGKIRLLLVIEAHEPMDAESLLFNLNFALKYSDNIDRMALVRSKAWEETWMGLFGLFSHIRTRYFDRSEIKEAWKWMYS